MLLLLVLLLPLLAGGLRSPLGRRFPARTSYASEPVDDQPLFLTPYIQAGQLEKARNLSQVVLEGTDVPSYSGYLTVNEQHNSNMFFWFFPAKVGAETAPVLLWLQGGPGGSSLFGLFVEHGPYGVDVNMNLVPRNYSWYNTNSMLYIDNPVGTGFSFTDDDAGYATNEDDVARDLHSALTQFFTLFDSYQNNDFYVTGESYAGKYVPAITHKIHQENPTASLKINLKGMAIGDGLCDPIHQLDYASVLYSVGLIDQEQTEFFNQKAEEVADLIRQGQFIDAFHAWDVVLNGDKTPYPTYYHNVTGFDNYFNYLYPIDPYNPDSNPYDQYVNLAATRSGIHVGSLPYNDGQIVEDRLLGDIMNSSLPYITGVLDAGYKVMVYNGQLDVIIAYVLTENWLATAQWSGADAYKSAKRAIWRPDGSEIAGYVRTAANLREVMVRNAGHMLPSDQPAWAYSLINAFISDTLPTA